MAPHPRRLGRCIGSGRSGNVYEALVNGAVCAVKLFADERDFANELHAYQSASTIDVLHGRVCGFLGVFEYRDARALCLQRLHGQTLHDALPVLSSEQRKQLQLQIEQTLDILHTKAGIAHGDIRAENIIVDGTSTYLIDFGYAIGKATRSADRWCRAQQDDYDCTAEVFSWAASEAAIRSVTHLLDRPRPLGMTQADQQTLADHLLLIQASIPDLIHAIQLAVPAPTPTLALALATRLARGSTAATREAAIAVLLDALARGELADYDLLCRMKKLAATTAGLLETFSIGPYRVGPGAVALYQEAADALRGRPADRPALLELQLKRAKFLAGRKAWDAALQVWLDVLAELGEGRKEGDFKIARELAWAMWRSFIVVGDDVVGAEVWDRGERAYYRCLAVMKELRRSGER